MTARAPFPQPVLSRHNARLAEALHNGWGDVPQSRAGRLYGQAYGEWLHGNRATFDRLHPLIVMLNKRLEEITPEEDAELRRAYRLEVKA